MTEVPLISLLQVGKSFKEGRLSVLQDISLDIKSGEFVSIVGPSGCGKTTLLRLINGLSKPDKGAVLVNGASPKPNADLGMVFQSARLLPWRTVAGNIEFVLKLKGLSRNESNVRAYALLEAVGLKDFTDAYPHELSGGMQSRLGLARALAVEPKVLLMDEPFAALDAMTRENLRGELLQLWSRRRMAVVFVTHDIDEAILMSQRIVLLSPRPGRIEHIMTVDLPEPRWQNDPRGLSAYAALRTNLWKRIQGMATEGKGLGSLAELFPDLEVE